MWKISKVEDKVLESELNTLEAAGYEIKFILDSAIWTTVISRKKDVPATVHPIKRPRKTDV